MAKCNWCGNRGLFLAVNKDGLCRSCYFIITSDAKNRIRIINDSGEIIFKSKNVETILSRSEVAISHLKELIKYEEKGIPILKQSVQEMIIEYANTANERIVELLRISYQGTTERLATLKSVNAKANAVDKFITRAREVKIFLNRKGSNRKECESLINEFIAELTEVNI